MKAKSPQQSVRLSAAIRYLISAQTELEEAGENLAAMRVGALLREFR